MEAVSYFFLSFLFGITAQFSAIVQAYLPSIILGYALSCCVDSAIKHQAIRQLKSIFDLNGVSFMDIVPWTLIHTYRSSYLHKDTIKYTRFEHSKIDAHFTRQMKSSFIRRANRYNLISSIFSIFLILPLHYLTFSDKGFWWLGVLFFVCIRAISRSLEIIYAFTCDVIAYDNNQASSLNKFDRIKLALTSYIENILNYTLVYVVLRGSEPSLLQSFFDSIGRSTISNVNLTATSCSILQAFAYLQVFTSLTLVVLSLAIYVGRKY